VNPDNLMRFKPTVHEGAGLYTCDLVDADGNVIKAGLTGVQELNLLTTATLDLRYPGGIDERGNLWFFFRQSGGGEPAASQIVYETVYCFDLVADNYEKMACVSQSMPVGATITAVGAKLKVCGLTGCHGPGWNFTEGGNLKNYGMIGSVQSDNWGQGGNWGYIAAETVIPSDDITYYAPSDAYSVWAEVWSPEFDANLAVRIEWTIDFEIEP